MIHIVTPLKDEFEQLFRATFSLKQNARFLASVQVRVYLPDKHYCKTIEAVVQLNYMYMLVLVSSHVFCL